MSAGKHAKCGAKSTRTGQPCRQPKGFGTDHVGTGRCKFHGGAHRNGRKAAAKEAALEFARGALGAEVAASPIDAMEQSVRLAMGLIVYFRHELAKAAAQSPPDVRRMEELRPIFTDAIKLEHDVGKGAVVAGVAERRQRLAERQAELLALAITDGLREAFGDLATPERRALFAAVTKRRLLVLEEDSEPLELEAGAA